ncbi:hypothetical protein [Noviherbaspirillum massiliense]|uniref:hypothetical protein n=1 Tax=Noviherbaspirillum massiliense TaxID=1465823 RepID=UPI0002F8797B|nr:hypothetical protein [Noviherbaspirillum massiliense]
MDVEVIYRQPDGTQTMLGIRKLNDLPPIGGAFQLDQRQYVAKSFGGPDAEGRYVLFLEDDISARH